MGRTVLYSAMIFFLLFLGGGGASIRMSILSQNDGGRNIVIAFQNVAKLKTDNNLIAISALKKKKIYKPVKTLNLETAAPLNDNSPRNICFSVHASILTLRVCPLSLWNHPTERKQG